jgi:hypothetical protein
MPSQDKLCFPITDSNARFPTLVETRALLLYTLKGETGAKKRSEAATRMVRLVMASRKIRSGGGMMVVVRKEIQRVVNSTPSLCLRRSKGMASSPNDRNGSRPECFVRSKQQQCLPYAFLSQSSPADADTSLRPRSYGRTATRGTEASVS